jgi:hypothetical protein
VASQSIAWRTIAGSLAVLVVSGWRRRRTGMPGPDTDPGRHRPAADVWHGDPRRAVVDRPAGADAESMAPDPGEPGAGPP